MCNVTLVVIRSSQPISKAFKDIENVKEFHCISANPSNSMTKHMRIDTKSIEKFGKNAEI